MRGERKDSDTETTGKRTGKDRDLHVDMENRKGRIVSFHAIF